MSGRGLLGWAMLVGCGACGGRTASTTSGDAGTLSDGAGNVAASAPVNAPRPRLACGASTSCYLADSGIVRCWGDGEFGELGGGSVALQPRPPTTVPRLSGVVGLGGGPLQMCAFDTADQAQC